MKTPTEYIVSPLKSIGPVSLRMQRDDVRSKFDSPFRSYRKTPNSNLIDAFLNSRFQVFYANDETVEFIEISGHDEQGLRILVGDSIDVFRTKVEDLISRLPKTFILDRARSEIPYSYVFSTISVTF